MVKDRKKEVTKAEIKRMKKLWNSRMTQTQIALEMGLSQRTVSKYIGKHQIDMTLKKRSGRTTGSFMELETKEGGLKPEYSMIGVTGLFLKEWAKVIFWIGMAVFIWRIITLK